MDTGQVTAIIQAGFLLLAEATRDVTGDPGALRARAAECARCAGQLDTAAGDTRRTVRQLGQTWLGQAYERTDQDTTNLNNLLVNVLRVALEQESRRLDSAATALTQATNTVEQQRQSFAQQANSVIQTMAQELARARAMPSPWNKIMMVLAILKAVQAALSAKQSAQSASDATRNQLSNTLATLFATSATSSGQLTTAGR
ncbi:hypothetical protein [Plantactinospora sonchi]|uniref:Uncharacterized protein n=1 Tax=Plantactinospora sonchi TaxID=1544735 RepID=A0ABU7RXU5_9ACTN